MKIRSISILIVKKMILKNYDLKMFLNCLPKMISKMI